MKLKESNPEGCLWKRYGRDRLRTMYKHDKELKIAGEVKLAKKPSATK